jgi:hypothetical protein
MKLQLNNPFTIEIDGTDEVIEGTIRELTKTEKEEVKKMYTKSEKDSKKLKKLTRKLQRLETELDIEEDKKTKRSLLIEKSELEDEIDVLSDSLNVQDLADMLITTRIERCVDSKQKDRILELCEIVGAQRVFEVILKGVEEYKGNDKRSS